MNKICCVDVDLTVVDIGESWLNWLNHMSGLSLTMEDCIPNYGFGDYFTDALKNVSMSPYDYFRQEGLYDTLEPIKGSVEALRRLKEHGWDIVFVSHIKGNHHKSKYNFLKRYFPFMEGFLATQEKHYVKHDMLIDDRNKSLNAADENAILVKMHTPYDQCQLLEREVWSLENWGEFEQFIEEVIKDGNR